MGTDIFIYAEKRASDVWEPVPNPKRISTKKRVPR